MSIKIIRGKVLCSLCRELIDTHEPFEINEIKYQVFCNNCLDSVGIRNRSVLPYNLPIRQHLLKFISDAKDELRTITIKRDPARLNLVKVLSIQGGYKK
jgi:hypothetical protein